MTNCGSVALDHQIERYLLSVEQLSRVPALDPGKDYTTGGNPSHAARLSRLVHHGLRRGPLLEGLSHLEASALALTVCGRALIQPPEGTPVDEGEPGYWRAWDDLDRAGALKQKEIAAYLGISDRTLRRLLRSARAKVNENLAQ